MMKYEFGIGSSKYELETNNDDVAYITMVMFYGASTIPIVIYKPNKKAIIGNVILDMDDLDGFMTKNVEELRKARKSIKEITA